LAASKNVSGGLKLNKSSGLKSRMLTRAVAVAGVSVPAGVVPMDVVQSIGHASVRATGVNQSFGSMPTDRNRSTVVAFGLAAPAESRRIVFPVEPTLRPTAAAEDSPTKWASLS
jgi:hypothetical protein